MPESPLPFEGFLLHLRNEGFAVGTDSFLRVNQLLEMSDGTLDPARLKTVLCPLLATNAEQQQRFHALFDRYYGVIGEPQSTEVSEPPTIRRAKTRRRWGWASAAILLVALLGSLVLIGRPRSRSSNQPWFSAMIQRILLPFQPGPVIKPPPSNQLPEKPSRESHSLWRPYRYLVSNPAPVKTASRWTGWIPVVLLALYAVWYLGRSLAGAYLLRKRPSTRPRPLYRAGSAHMPFENAPPLMQSVRRLRRRLLVPSTQLDIDRTIVSTIEHATYPQIHFRMASYRAEYIVLVDRISAGDHQAALFNEMVAQLRQDGQIALDAYFFNGDPRVLIDAKTGKSVYLADLLERAPDHRLLVFGDGTALWNSFTGELTRWARALLRRPNVAILTPQMEGWDAKEQVLSEATVLQPATWQGLSDVVDAFEGRPVRTPKPGWQPGLPEYPTVETPEYPARKRLDDFVDALRRYLGPANFRWVAACSVCPRLDWNLSLHLGAFLDPGLLDSENVLRVATLPWFRKGYFPLALQQALFEQLDREERTHLNAQVVSLVEKGIDAPGGRTSVELIVQRFGISPTERRRMEQDEPLIRLAMTAGHSEVAFRISQRIRRALFRFGVPSFGLRAAPLAAFAVIGVIGIAFAVIPTPRQKQKDRLVPELLKLYDFPTEYDGTGQCIGLLEFGGGYRDSGLDSYFARMRLHKPTITPISIDGAKNQPSPMAGDGEVEMNIEIVGTVCPSARIAVYFAPFTTQGWVDAITRVANDGNLRPSVLAIGWGLSESEWPQNKLSVQAVNDALQSAAMKGITVVAAAGDDGAADQITDGLVHVGFPASSPWVLACGGTTKGQTANSRFREVVWNTGTRMAGGGTTGGGVSDLFPAPSWQSSLSIRRGSEIRHGRGIPDIAAIAAPANGYMLLVDGNWGVTGGTSAAMSVWAGLIALINQGIGHNVGYINPVLYQILGPQRVLHAAFGPQRNLYYTPGPRVLNAVTEGNNTVNNVQGYSAGPGWNACAGWGSPDGRQLLEAFRSLQ